MAAPNWKEFGPDIFAQAKQQQKPILMLLTAPWCAHCRELLQTTFSNSEVLQRLANQFIPVMVDAERRPDVNTRYGTGGWPTIAYLTSSGELVSQDQFLSAKELLEQMNKVHAHLSANGAQIEEGLQSLQPRDGKGQSHSDPAQLDAKIVEDVADAIYDKFDHRYGGWGEGSKFPHPEALDFALVMAAKRNDQRMREVAKTTLDKMMEGAIHDTVDGGFFRFSRTPDWRSPNFEKVLDANAQRLRCYLEAYQIFGDEGYRKCAEGIVDWTLNFMLDADSHAFAGSQDADADYYALDKDGRANRPVPKLDSTIYTNWNAMAISSLLKASVVLSRPDLKERALQATNFLLENLYDGNGTVYHYWDGTYHLPGLLADQAYLIRALIDVSQHTGNADLLQPAETIALQALERQRASEGGFYDILKDAQGQGSMSRRNRSILENSVMAESLVRLSYLVHRTDLYDEAITAMQAFTNVYKEYGYYVAAYGRAIDLVFYPPLNITIVGDRDSAEAEAMRNTALLTYMPSRMVQTLDPKLDPILMGRGGYQAGDRCRAYLSVGKTTMEMVENPEELLSQMEQVEQQRRQRD